VKDILRSSATEEEGISGLARKIKQAGKYFTSPGVVDDLISTVDEVISGCMEYKDKLVRIQNTFQQLKTPVSCIFVHHLDYFGNERNLIRVFKL